jgi:hypothetical protein
MKAPSKQRGCLTVPCFGFELAIPAYQSLPGNRQIGMGKLFSFIGSTIGGYIGWYIGAPVGFTTAFIVSMVGTGVGMYYGRVIAKNYIQ